MNEIIFQTAQQLAQAIREREVSAVEVLEAHLNHIVQHNSALNAIVTLNEERARQRAEEADKALASGESWGPLHGVPVTIKDALETAGLRTTSSFKPLADYIPQENATVVARLSAAGAIIMGKTNLPQLALDFQCNSPVFGLANNPWDVSYTPGGSTGGGAAAIASGMSPLEIGSDIGGSIRLPAHFCGVFGHKPTENLVSIAGHIPEPPGAPRGVRHMAVVGPLARSVGDLRLALTLIAGPDSRRWEVPPVALSPPPERPLPERRFAWTDDFGGVPVTADTRAALEKLVERLSQLGCHIERQQPAGFDFTSAWETWGELGGAEIGATTPAIARVMMRVQFGTMSGNSPLNRGFARGLRLSMPRYAVALSRRDVLIQALEQFLEQWDAWLCPVAVTPAFTHRKMGQSFEIEGQAVPYLMGGGAYTTVFNMTGSPVTIIPLTRSQEGLPIGVQVVGRRWHDMETLAVAEQLAEVIEPFQRPPSY
jgi:amidase